MPVSPGCHAQLFQRHSRGTIETDGVLQLRFTEAAYHLMWILKIQKSEGRGATPGGE
jgi:hypothetical protein